MTGEVGARFSKITGPQNYAFVIGTFIDRITLKEVYNELGLELGVVCFPEFPKRTIYGGCSGFFVYSKTKNPDAAATFALFLLTDEGQKAFNSSVGGALPTTKVCYEDDFWRIPFEANSTMTRMLHIRKRSLVTGRRYMFPHSFASLCMILRPTGCRDILTMLRTIKTVFGKLKSSATSSGPGYSIQTEIG